MVKPLANTRLNTARQLMASRQLDALIVYSQRRGHIAYLSGYRPNYHTNSAFMVLPRDDDPALLIKFGFDMPRARAQSWIEDIRAGHSEDARCLFAEFAEILTEKGLRNARLGWVASDDTIDEMSASLWGAVQEGLPNARLEPASDLVNSMRLSKGPEEVELLRRGTQIGESAADALRRSLEPGVDDYAAAAEATATGVSLGAGRCDVILSPRPPDLALPPKHDQFRQGDAVSLELTVEYEGYWVQICRTFSIGPPSPMQKRVFAACRDAYEAGVSLARPGARAADLAQAAIAVVDKAGFPGSIKYGLGHGVGLDLPEPCSVDTHSNAVLTDQMALIIHVGAWVDGAAAFVGGPIIVDGSGPIVLDQPQREILEV